MGILDPAKVTRTALQAATSIAGLMITPKLWLLMLLVRAVLLVACLIWAVWCNRVITLKYISLIIWIKAWIVIFGFFLFAIWYRCWLNLSAWTSWTQAKEMVYLSIVEWDNPISTVLSDTSVVVRLTATDLTEILSKVFERLINVNNGRSESFKWN